MTSQPTAGTMPQSVTQAFSGLNGEEEEILAQADAFAQRLLQTGGDDPAKIRLAFEMAHGRTVTESQSLEAVAFLDAYRQKLNGSPNALEQAWAGLARVLLTSNAFLYVD